MPARRDEAVAAFREAIRLRGTFGEAWWSLSNMKIVEFGKADIAAMLKNIKKCKNPIDVLHFNFALGKAYEDRKISISPSGIILRGIASGRAAFRPPSCASPRGSMRRSLPSRQSWPSAWLAPDATRPIRSLWSGCSGRDRPWWSRILASHPDVEGAGELLTLDQLWADLGAHPFATIAGYSPEELRALGQRYLD